MKIKCNSRLRSICLIAYAMTSISTRLNVFFKAIVISVIFGNLQTAEAVYCQFHVAAA